MPQSSDNVSTPVAERDRTWVAFPRHHPTAEVSSPDTLDISDVQVANGASSSTTLCHANGDNPRPPAPNSAPLQAQTILKKNLLPTTLSEQPPASRECAFTAERVKSVTDPRLISATSLQRDSPLPSPAAEREREREERQSEMCKQHSTHQRMRVDLFEDTEAIGCGGAFVLSLQNTFQSLRRLGLFSKLTWVDFQARRGTYVISFCSVFVVVLLCVAMISILTSLPVIFLRLAEPNAGQADLVLAPGGQLSSASSLNYTAIRRILAGYPESTHLHAPRVEFYAYAFKPKTCRTRHVVDLWFPFPAPNEGDALDSLSSSAETAEGATFERGTRAMGGATAVRRVCSRTCYDEWCETQVGPVVAVYALNTTQEDLIGFGPYADYPYETPPKGFAVLSRNVAGDLNVRAGDDIFLVAIELNGVLDQFYAEIPEERRNYNALLQLTVKVVVKSYSYKFPDTDNYILINYEHLGEMLAEGMSPLISDAERVSVSKTPTDHAVSAVYFRMPSGDRYGAYVHSSYTTIRRNVRDWGTVIVNALGSNQLAPSTPILRFLKTTEFFSTFVGLIMSIIILVLAVLSVLLIYSLLSVSIDTRMYELGVQRMIGFTRENLVVMVLTNAYFFTLPAWLIGLAAGQGVYSALRAVLKHFVEVEVPVGVSGASVGFATLAGLLIPLVASIFPILSVITLRLSNALDSTRGRAIGVVYKIRKNDSSHLNGTMLGLGFLFFVLGFLLYYLFPNSLMNQNLTLMFYIFFFVLIGMLAGLVLLASNFQRVIETVILYALFFWESRPVFRMVLKSLAAHRLRNRKTALMYSLSLAFIIFVTVAFQIQIVSMEYSEMRNMGTQVAVSFARRQRPLGSYGQTGSAVYAEGAVSPEYEDAGKRPDDFSSDSAASTSTNGDAVPYKARPVIPAFYELNYGVNFYLDDYLQLRKEMSPWMKSGVVSAMSLRGGGLPPVSWNLQYLFIQTPGRYQSSGWHMEPIAPNLYNTLDGRFTIVHKYDDQTAKYGISEALYTQAGVRQLVLATTTYRTFGFTTLRSPGICRSGLRINETSSTVRVADTPRVFTTSTVMDSSPVALMTKYPNNLGDILVSYPALAYYSGIPLLSVRSMPTWTVFVRVPNKANYKAVKTALSRFMSRNGFYPTIKDVETAVADTRTANTILTIFFIFTLILILVICLFSLMSSMTANVLDSSKEIAVLLCLGMTHFQVYRVYVWEAFILVFASGLLGLLVGIIVAYTMQMQNVLFTQLSIPFSFPYIQLCIVAGVGLLSALAASVGPVSYLLGLPSVTHILRRTVH